MNTRPHLQTPSAPPTVQSTPSAIFSSTQMPRPIKTIRDEEIVHEGGWLGPGVELENCHVVLHCRTEVTGIRAKACAFAGTFKQNHTWVACELYDCTFEGRVFAQTFCDPEFGPCALEGCDFRQAVLDVLDCTEFFAAMPGTNVLPGWPTFYLRGNHGAAAEVRAKRMWPPGAAWVLDAWDFGRDCPCVAMDAREVARNAGVSVDELFAIVKGVKHIRASKAVWKTRKK